MTSATAGAAWGVFVRSPHAFADIRGIDTAAAQAAPGVLAVLTAADLDAAGIGSVSVPVPVPGSPGMVSPHRPSLARDCVRHVGDPVALVVAESEAEARDAAELVEVDYAARDAVTDVARAAAPGAPQIWPEAPGNLAVDWHPYGAKPEDRAELDRIFAGAAHVATGAARQSAHRHGADGAARRRSPSTSPKPTATCCRSPRKAPSRCASTLRARWVCRSTSCAWCQRRCRRRVRHAHLRLSRIPGDAARGEACSGRPVRWRSTRQEGFLTDNQARDTIIEGRLAIDADGKFLALDIDSIAALGAYHTSHGAFIATVNFARCLPCMYDIPAIGLRIRCLFTNTVPTGPYRGAGRPEANYCLERLVDEAARITGIDRIEIRRRNLIAPARMPYKTAVGTTYDSGDFPAVFDEALASADVAGFAARRAASQAAGKRRGLGVSCFLEIAGGQPGEGAADRLSRLQQAAAGDRRAGERAGAPHGLSPPRRRPPRHPGRDHRGRAWRQRRRGAERRRGRLALDDVGRRRGRRGARRGDRKGKRVAAHVLEAAEADIVYRDGVFEIAGTDRNIALFELADRAKQLGDSLDAKSSFDAAPSFPNGVHVAEVEIDPATGRTTLAAYTCVDDCGRVLQPVLVEGQVQGGVAQGVGQALLEWGHYDDASGQLVAGSFMDYAMPRADDLPDIVSELHPVRCTTNPLGVKGVGEAGTTASLAAVMNAVADAGANIDMPATPERVWRALSAHGRGT